MPAEGEASGDGERVRLGKLFGTTSKLIILIVMFVVLFQSL